MKYQPQHRNGDNSAFFEEVKNFEDTIDLTHILSNEVLMPDTKLTHKVLNITAAVHKLAGKLAGKVGGQYTNFSVHFKCKI